jgi:hypothetical protein
MSRSEVDGEDGGNMVLRNFGILPNHRMAPQLREPRPEVIGIVTKSDMTNWQHMNHPRVCVAEWRKDEY